ncbi:MAG TPA: helix-turn-helix transcriptional regulator [Thermoanaerobaculia bacterium]|nr:helix-turn-helix transcriptional regulator [Thermoanaerobaculia bacterium]
MKRIVQPEGELFGKRLNELRTRRGWTQGELGQKAHLTVAYISNLENGFSVPSLTTILRLAVALECKATALVSVFDRNDLSHVLTRPISGLK